MSQRFARKPMYALGAGAILGAYLLPAVISALRSGPASVLRPAEILSWIVATVTFVLGTLCVAEIASTAPVVAGSVETIAYAATGERLAWMLGWPLLLAFAVTCVALVIIGSRIFGFADFLPIEALVHLTTLFAFVVASVAADVLAADRDLVAPDRLACDRPHHLLRRTPANPGRWPGLT